MSLKLVPKWKGTIDPDVVEAIEEMLALAKAGKIQRLLILGMEDNTRIAHRMRHRCCDVAMIGALSSSLQAIQRDYEDAAPTQVPEDAA